MGSMSPNDSTEAVRADEAIDNAALAEALSYRQVVSALGGVQE